MVSALNAIAAACQLSLKLSACSSSRSAPSSGELMVLSNQAAYTPTRPAAVAHTYALFSSGATRLPGLHSVSNSPRSICCSSCARCWPLQPLGVAAEVLLLLPVCRRMRAATALRQNSAPSTCCQLLAEASTACMLLRYCGPVIK